MTVYMFTRSIVFVLVAAALVAAALSGATPWLLSLSPPGFAVVAIGLTIVSLIVCEIGDPLVSKLAGAIERRLLARRCSAVWNTWTDWRLADGWQCHVCGHQQPLVVAGGAPRHTCPCGHVRCGAGLERLQRAWDRVQWSPAEAVMLVNYEQQEADRAMAAAGDAQPTFPEGSGGRGAPQPPAALLSFRRLVEVEVDQLVEGERAPFKPAGKCNRSGCCGGDHDAA